MSSRTAFLIALAAVATADADATVMLQSTVVHEDADQEPPAATLQTEDIHNLASALNGDQKLPTSADDCSIITTINFDACQQKGLSDAHGNVIYGKAKALDEQRAKAADEEEAKKPEIVTRKGLDPKTKKAAEDVVKKVVKAVGVKAPAAPAVSASAAGAEFVAMTLFVVIGCGSAMSVAKESGWILQVALTFGLAITSLAYAVGHYSGGQINCAVTFGLMFAGKLSMAQGMANFVAQMLGSVTGALILRAMYPEEKDKTGGLATNKVADGWTQTNAFVGEFMMTFLLMFVVLETAVNPASKANRELACVAIGFAVFLAHSVLISVDGCSINPTRTFGPALVRKMCYKNSEGAFDDMWVFWAGPIAGAVFAAIVSAQLMAS